jgi:hypothetical protein
MSDEDWEDCPNTTTNAIESHNKISHSKTCQFDVMINMQCTESKCQTKLFILLNFSTINLSVSFLRITSVTDYEVKTEP